MTILGLNTYLQAVSHYPSSGQGFTAETRFFEIKATPFSFEDNNELKTDYFRGILWLWFAGKESNTSRNEKEVLDWLNGKKQPETSLENNFLYCSGNAVDDFIELLTKYFTNSFQVYKKAIPNGERLYPFEESFLLQSTDKALILHLGLTD